MTMKDEAKKFWEEVAAQQRIQRDQNELGKQWWDQPAIPFNPRPLGPTPAAYDTWMRGIELRLHALETTHLNSAGGVYERLSNLEKDVKAALSLTVLVARVEALEKADLHLNQRITALEEGQLGAKGDVVIAFNEQIRELKGRLNKLENPDNRLDNPTVSLRRDVGHLYRALRRVKEYAARLPLDCVQQMDNALALFAGDYE